MVVGWMHTKEADPSLTDASIQDPSKSQEGTIIIIELL